MNQTLSKAVHLLHPFGTLLVVVGIALNLLETFEVVVLTGLDPALAWVVRLVPLLGGAAAVFASVLLAPDDG